MFSASVPLCYCTNVHPCRKGSDVERVLDQYTIPVRQRCGFDIGAGLWLPADALGEVIVDSTRMKAVRQALDARGLVCYTLNAFPYGDFHSERVKEQVYLPDWSDSSRLDYTTECAELLAHLLPDGMDGSISTLPLASKLFRHADDFYPIVIAHLIELANRFDRLATHTGQIIRLAIEPEPYCLLETTAETVEFFQRLWSVADDVGCGEVARRHLGVCYDVCHQAVEFENAADAIRALQQADIRINKVQISCAIELEDASDTAGVAEVYDESRAAELHLNHPRSGDFIVLAEPDSWFTYYYWLDDARCPDFAPTVDIHRKPGYDPAELFINPELKFPKLKIARKLLRKKLGFRYLMDVIPIHGELVRGSHGLAAASSAEAPVFISARTDLVREPQISPVAIRSLLLQHLQS